MNELTAQEALDAIVVLMKNYDGKTKVDVDPFVLRKYISALDKNDSVLIGTLYSWLSELRECGFSVCFFLRHHCPQSNLEVTPVSKAVFEITLSEKNQKKLVSAVASRNRNDVEKLVKMGVSVERDVLQHLQKPRPFYEPNEKTLFIIKFLSRHGAECTYWQQEALDKLEKLTRLEQACQIKDIDEMEYCLREMLNNNPEALQNIKIRDLMYVLWMINAQSESRFRALLDGCNLHSQCTFFYYVKDRLSCERETRNMAAYRFYLAEVIVPLDEKLKSYAEGGNVAGVRDCLRRGADSRVAIEIAVFAKCDTVPYMVELFEAHSGYLPSLHKVFIAFGKMRPREGQALRVAFSDLKQCEGKAFLKALGKSNYFGMTLYEAIVNCSGINKNLLENNPTIKKFQEKCEKEKAAKVTHKSSPIHAPKSDKSDGKDKEELDACPDSIPLQEMTRRI